MLVRILSMMDVGPKDKAKAKTPKEAAAPSLPAEKVTRSIAMKTPVPQNTTSGVLINWLRGFPEVE